MLELKDLMRSLDSPDIMPDTQNTNQVFGSSDSPNSLREITNHFYNKNNGYVYYVFHALDGQKTKAKIVAKLLAIDNTRVVSYARSKEEKYYIEYKGSKILVVLELERLFAASNHSDDHLFDFIRESALETHLSADWNIEVSVNVIYLCETGLREERTDIQYDDIGDIYTELHADIDIDLLAKEFMASNEAILIVAGEPGVGKTTIIKYLIRNYCRLTSQVSSDFNTQIAYAKDEKAIRSPGFWAKMNNNYKLIILDDIDKGLEPRTQDSNDSFMSQLLSFSDGIFCKGPKIVITTNMPIREVDPALVRPGRCFDFITMSPLEYDYARNFWIDTLKLDPNYFDSRFSDQKTVTQAGLFSEAKRLKENAVTRSYIKKGSNTYTIESKLRNQDILPRRII